MAGLRIHTVMPSELVGRIDSAAAAAGVSRGEFVRGAVERALEPATVCACGRGYEHASTVECRPVASEQALGSSGRAGVRGRVPASAPAEQPSSLAEDLRELEAVRERDRQQNVDVILGKASEGLEFNRGSRVRSSSVARPFRPAPKQGKK